MEDNHAVREALCEHLAFEGFDVRGVDDGQALTTELALNQRDEGLQQSIGDFLDEHRFGTEFRQWYFLPMIGCIWSCPTAQMLQFPIATMIRFCHNHGLLQVSDIDSERMIIRVEQGKGRKDRNAMLSPHLLDLLRQWWREGKRRGVMFPHGWLFPGQSHTDPISSRQLHRAVAEAAETAGIRKRVSPHTLRHSFATHLLEDGVDIRVIQALLGHAKLNTTAFYTQVATRTIRAVISPLDRLASTSPGRDAPDG